MKAIQIEIKWAVIFAIAGLAWMLLERLLGLHDVHIERHSVYTNFYAVPAIAIFVFALLDKRKNHYNGKMTYLQGFISGLVITLIVTVLSPLTQIITSLLITPEYFENAIRNAVRQGEMTEEAAKEYFSLSNYIVLGLIGAPVMGLVTSAVVAIFMRKS